MRLAHPLLDPLHATERAQVVHDATDAQAADSDAQADAPVATEAMQWSELDFPMPDDFSLD